MTGLEPPEHPKCIFAASTGGHLTQLVRLSERCRTHEDSLWLTFENEQSISILKGRRTKFVPYVAPRDWRGVMRAFWETRAVLGTEEFPGGAYSTGAGMAIGVFAAGRMAGLRTIYVESVSRVSGPSLTGRLLSGSRLAREVYTQHPSWAGRRWEPIPSVLTEYVSSRRADRPTSALRVFVTLGTISPYRFDRLVDGVNRCLGPEDTVVWQVGATKRADLNGTVYDSMPAAAFRRELEEADVVVSHAGVGTLLDALDRGIHLVLCARSSAAQEHVDDHQRQIAKHAQDLGIASVVSPESLDRSTLVEASMQHVKRAAGSTD